MNHHHQPSNENSNPNPKQKLKLRPPPCPYDSPRFSKPGIYVPLPPCAFQPLLKKPLVLRRDDDPFFAAYMKCTKAGEPEKGKGGGLWMKGFDISCKKSCGVIDDAMVRVSQVPVYHGGRKSSFTVRELKEWEKL
ncbi:hypothetical protein DsansV1_C25g0187691 [Dioscorea sansibarensis]